MEDKSFAQAIEELNQRTLKDITDEALRCWMQIQQGGTVNSVTEHIENEHMREEVKHILFYVLLQSLLFDARQRELISNSRYEELKGYVNSLGNQIKQQPLITLPLTLM